LLLSSEPGWAEPIPIGAEFQINTITTSDQMFPNLGAAAGGTFVVTWQDYAASRIVGRIHDGTAAPQGVEFEVADPGYDSAVAVGAGAGFVVAWERYGDVFAQRRDPAGAALGGPFQVNTHTTGDQGLSDVAADATGRFVVVWESQSQDGNGRGVFAQRYDSAGAALGGEFQVNTYTTGYQAVPAIAAAPAGDFLVVWSDGQSDGSAGIFAQRYDSAGAALGGEFQVNTDSTAPNGPGVSVSPSGEFVIVWVNDDGDGSGIFGQRYDSAGAALGGEFQVNTYTTSDQVLGHATFGLPRARPVAHDTEGRFMVVWHSFGQDGSLSGVFGRRYTRAGVPDGAETQINTYTTGHQHAAHVASTSAGGFLVVWENDPQDGSPIGIAGRRVRIGGLPVSGRRLAIRTPPSGPTYNRMAYVSRDPNLATPLAVPEDPRCPPLGSGDVAAGATLRLSGPGGAVEIDLPCVNWVGNATRTSFTYQDSTGTTCRRVVIREGRGLRAVCKGPQLTYTLGAPQVDVTLVLATGAPATGRAYCAAFGPPTAPTVVHDGSNGRTYRAVNALAPGACP
jgi:hypothetical protein